jgi:hypothetical protein
VRGVSIAGMDIGKWRDDEGMGVYSDDVKGSFVFESRVGVGC